MSKLGGFLLEIFSKIIPVFIGIVLTITLFLSLSPVLAENMKCPKNKTCYLAQQHENGKITCRHNENEGWKFLKPLKKCGEQEEEKKPTKTSKPDPTRKPDPTAKPTDKSDPTDSPTDIPDPGDPTSTPFQPKNTPVPTNRDNDPKDPTITPTPTCTIISPYPSPETTDCPWCELMMRLVKANERQASAQETMAAK